MRQLTFYARLMLSLLCFGCLVPCPAGAQAVSVLMQHNDSSRTGSNLSETTLNTSNVNVNQFGKLFTRSVDGQIYAQPLYVPSVTIAGTAQNVVYVVTMHNSVYAFDADDPTASTPLWQVNLGASVPSTCSDNNREYGILSTPAIDTSTDTIYVVARTTESNSSIAYRLHALDIATGAEKPNSPVVIQASVPGTGTGSVNGTITFDPTLQLNRPGLLLTGGNVYLAFGSECDGGNYHGWLMSYNATTLVQTAVLNTAPNGGHGGIWQTGNGPALDSSGNICVITGDGSFDANQPGGFDYGDTFIKFSPALSILDWFTPDNYVILQQQNLDLGTGGPLMLPGTTYMVGGGKQGVVYVVDTTNMGHVDSSDNSQIVQTFQATNGGAIIAAPIYWSGPNGQFIYVWGQGDPLKQFQFSGGLFGTTAFASSSVVSPGYPSGGGPLSLSSNGAASGTGIVWATGAVNVSSFPPPGILRAYDATNVGTELWDSYQNQTRDDFGLLAKFAPPTVANGKVYVATLSDQLVVYGLLSNLSGPTVTAESPTVGSTGVAVAAAVTATFSTAMKASTITTGTFTLTPSGGSPVAAAVSYNSTTHVATMTPSANLANNTTYTATVVGGSGGVTDASGNPMASSFTWTFTTVGTASAPTVTVETPASGGTAVPVTIAVTVTFSTAMSAATITTSTFSLSPSGGSPVAALVSYNSSTNVATLTPSASLANNTTYTATVVGGSSGVKSSSGIAMTSSVAWSFTTGPSGSSPIPTTGLGVWFKADSGISLNGSTVSAWADQSGNSNNATQPVVSAQPTVASGVINGLPAVNFAGSANMQFNLPVNGLTGMTIFLVNANAASYTGGGGDVSNAPLFWDETADWGTVYLSPFEQSVKWGFGTGQVNNMPSYTRPASIGTAFTLTDVVKNGTTENLYVAGTLVATQTGVLGTIANTQSTGNLGVGYLSTPWNGQIAEVIVYTVALTDAQRQQVEQYLTTRYFPSGSSGPTVTAQSPASGATGVAVSTAVTATFSAAMNASTITANTFTLAPSGGSPVATTVSYNATANVATLTPSASLANDTSYTATVVGGSGGITGSSGSPLASNVTWTFTTATSGSSPIPTTGLGVWFKADAGITLNGSTVSEWADQSGNGNNATQPVVGAQPTVASGAINGLPAVNFAGSANMQFNLPVNGLTGMTIFMVNANAASYTGGSDGVDNAPLFWDETADWGTVHLSPFEQSVNWAFGTGQVNNTPSYTRPASIGTAFTLTDVVKNGTTENLYVGGTLVATQTGVLGTIANTQSTGNLGVGYLSTPWNGQIAEVIVYTVALTDAQRQQVEQYLTSRYFPGGSSAPPSVFIDAPKAGSTVSGTVSIVGWAIDNASSIGTAIGSVQVAVDGAKVGNATYGSSRPDVCAAYPGRPGCPNVGFSYSLNTATLSAGSHTVTVSATDTDSTPDTGSASVTIVVAGTPPPAPPSVFIDAPKAGSTVSGTVSIVGWAIDNTSSVGTAIGSVQVAVDGAKVGNATYGSSRPDVCAAYPGRPGCPNVGFSYSLNTATLSAGSHTVTVSATDTDSTPDTGSASVTIVVAGTPPPAPPSVFIDAPKAGSTVSGTVSIVGWAIDNTSSVGTAIGSVQVAVDGAKVGNATYGSSRPDVCAAYPGRPGCPNVGFSYSLDTTKLTAGIHALTVTATDSDSKPDSGSSTLYVTVQ